MQNQTIRMTNGRKILTFLERFKVKLVSMTQISLTNQKIHTDYELLDQNLDLLKCSDTAFLNKKSTKLSRTFETGVNGKQSSLQCSNSIKVSLTYEHLLDCQIAVNEG